MGDWLSFVLLTLGCWLVNYRLYSGLNLGLKCQEKRVLHLVIVTITAYLVIQISVFNSKNKFG